MFRLFQRLITILAALVICAAIFYLVSLFYQHIGAATNNVKDLTKPKDSVVYVMTFKNSGSPKSAPSPEQQPKPAGSPR